MIALTATADRATRADIVRSLFPQEPLTFIHSFDRPNLSLAFQAKDQPRRQIVDFLEAQGQVSGSSIAAAGIGRSGWRRHCARRASTRCPTMPDSTSG